MLIFLAFFAVAIWSFVCLCFVEVPNSSEKRFEIYIPISLLDFVLALFSLWLFKNITYTGTIDWKKAKQTTLSTFMTAVKGAIIKKQKWRSLYAAEGQIKQIG